MERVISKPLIGISCGCRDKNQEYCLKDPYVKAVAANSEVPVILPALNEESLIHAMLAAVDGLVLSGGGDIEPALYRQFQQEGVLQEVDADRDRFEITLVQLAIQKNKPILAICRGMQIVNVACGGTLLQEITTTFPEALCHTNTMTNSEYHSVMLEPDSMIAHIMGEHVMVNSAHHQAILELGTGLRRSGVSSDGIIEAIEYTGDSWLIGVQWHPERIIAETGMASLFQILSAKAMAQNAWILDRQK